GIVSVYEAGEAGAICYLTAAFCPGISLKDWLAQHPTPVPPGEAAAFVATLAEAVHYIHDRGVLHRDLKPGNILLEGSSERQAGSSPLPEWLPKITDFGLAKLAEESASALHTRSGAVLGTLHYMAPEQALGRLAAIGPATDVYA